MMGTTIDIDLKLLEEIEKLLGEKSPSKGVNKALTEFIRRRKVEELIAMAGQIEFEDNWRELEELELAEMKRTERGNGSRLIPLPGSISLSSPPRSWDWKWLDCSGRTIS